MLLFNGMLTCFCQVLPCLTDRERVTELVDPVLEGQYSKKELIQVPKVHFRKLNLFMSVSIFLMCGNDLMTLKSTHLVKPAGSSHCSNVCSIRSRLSTSDD